MAGAGAARAADALVEDPLQYVHTLAGTSGPTNNFPGPAMPFGMVQFSPDTNGNSIAGPYTSSLRGKGYEYNDQAIRGFSMTHASQGCGYGGDFPILPTTWSDLTGTSTTTAPWNRRILKDPASEVGEPGYYKVTANDGSANITSELSATTRGGVSTFTYPAGTTPKVFLKANQASWTSRYSSAMSIDPQTGIVTAQAQNGNFCRKGSRVTTYYALEFEQPIATSGTWVGGTAAQEGRTAVTSGGSNVELGGYLTFAPGTTVVRARMAISYVSAENALLNLKTEIPTLDATTLGTVRDANRAAWSEYLGKVRVSQPVAGQSDADQRTFYTALYHSITHPSTFSDVNGQYLGFETQPKVHNVSESPGANGRTRVQYSMFSDWDTYRSQAQWVSMLWPQIASDHAQSLVNAAGQMGSFPKWTVANTSTNQMNGDSVVPLLGAIYAFGARDWDVSTALDHMVEAAVGETAGQWTGGTNQEPGNTGVGTIERPAANVYNERQYAPQIWQYQADHAVTGASYTQEFAVADFAISQLASALGERQIADQFMARSHYWQNLFNPTTQYVQPRDLNGKFPEGDPHNTSVDFGYRGFVDTVGQVGFEEGNVGQYLWFEPHDIAGLVNALGGKQTAIARLDDFVSHGLVNGPWTSAPYMNLDNEPAFGVPWIYNYLGEPWRTTDVVDEATQTLFGYQPSGAEPGNDDLGALASWYVWSALGVYPVTPGTDDLAVNTPLFDEAVVQLGSGRTLTIEAPGAHAGRDQAPKYINGMRVNNRPQTATYVAASRFDRDTTIEYDVSATHNDWGTGPHDAPPSWSEGGNALAANVSPTGNALFGVLAAAPGGTATGALDVQRITSTASTYTVSASARSGITLDDVGTLAFDAKGHGTTALTFHVDPSVPAGYYDAKVTVQAVQAGHASTTADVTLRVSAPGTFEATRTVVGSAYSDAPRGSFDGSASNAYSRDALDAVGLTAGSVHDVAADGVTTSFGWPTAPHGYTDTMVPNGQVVTLERPAERLSFIGAGVSGGASDTATLTLSDGSTTTTSTADLSFGDWLTPSANGDPSNGTLAPAYGNTEVAWTPKRLGTGTPGAYVFATKPYVAPAGTKIVSVTFPKDDHLRVFAIAQDAPALTATPSTVSAGQQISVSGSGFAPGEPVTLSLDTTPSASVTTAADGQGDVTAGLTVPRSAHPGTVHVTATAESQPRPTVTSIQVGPHQ
jgi:predicted alpha-1,2-mannosidase